MVTVKAIPSKNQILLIIKPPNIFHIKLPRNLATYFPTTKVCANCVEILLCLIFIKHKLLPTFI